MWRLWLVTWIMAWGAQPWAEASDRPDAGIEGFLKSFHADPFKEMDRLPDEVLPDGSLKPRGYIRWKAVEESLQFRLETRDSLVGELPWQPIGLGENLAEGKDFAERLVEGGTVQRNLQDLENRGLTRADLKTPPWTDSYWPMYKGVIGIRYADPGFPNSNNWLTNYSYIRSRSAAGIVASGDSAAINRLSPAEKYDYAVGDMGFSLSSYAWRQGEKHYNKYGRVAKWMGICHGWAGAAHMHAKVPDKPVTVIAASGRPVTFYPGDIKALQSMLWAKASPETRFVGNRCYVSRPQKNAYGRILDESCFDSNPATWHLAVTNQMGIHNRSFVMDSTFDAEVWNYPLASYRYRYFHPETWKEGATLRSSLVPIEKYRVDKFKQFRSPKARYVVGVFMDVTHISAVRPTRSGGSKAPTKTVRLVYDLELDENLNIIGGEWYSNAHPDFLWTFAKDSQAMTSADQTVLQDPWTPRAPVPGHWAAAAQRASGRGAPLWAFVRWLADAPRDGAEEIPEEEPEVDDGT